MPESAFDLIIPADPPRELCLMGVKFLLDDYDSLIRRLANLDVAAGAIAVDFSNTQTTVMRRIDPGFERNNRVFDWVLPDGMPLVWCLNMKGAKLSDRVYGPTFMRRFIQIAPNGSSHYLLGGNGELMGRLIERMKGWNAGITIAGSCTDFFGDDGTLLDGTDEGLVAEINRLAPDFVWVGLGTPKQQAWIARNKSKLKKGIILGVGFAFDVNAGVKADAPLWMQRAGLGWLYRLLCEPRRLGTRYLKYNTLFLAFILSEYLLGERLSKRNQVD